MNTRIVGGKIITPDGLQPADLRVCGDQIEAVTPPGQLPAPAGEETEFDASRKWLLPGAVDAHTHFGMPLGNGITSLGWRPSSEAALLGGTTTVVDFANPEPGEPLTSAVQRWRAAADNTCLCDFGLHCTVTDTSAERLDEIPDLVAAGIPTFKGFLAYKGRLMLTSDQMKALMVAVQAAGGMLLVHAENGEMNDNAQRQLVAAGRTAPRWHPAAHPPQSEVSAVRLALALAQQSSCPLTIVHTSLEASLQSLRRTRQGTPTADVYGEVCLHHLAADDSQYELGPEKALAAICSPPLRANQNTRSLLAGLSAGDLDLLSTDHCEFPLSVKLKAAAGGFPKVPNGCGGVGERLTLAYTLAVANGAMTPWRWQEVCCRKPAEIMGLSSHKGYLQPGFDADIVAFNPRDRYPWQPLGSSDVAGNIYAGTPAVGKVTDVWLRGQQMVASGKLLNNLEPGQFISRALSPRASF